MENLAPSYAYTAVDQTFLYGVGRRIMRASLVGLAVFVLFWLIVVPLFMVLMVSFRSGSPLELGPFTFANYALTYSYPLTYKTLLNSVLYAGVSVLIVMSVAVLFAWLVERTDMPCRGVAWALILLPIGMPSFLLTMSWMLLLNPRVGVLNQILRALLGSFGLNLETGPINIYSLGGMIFVNSITGLTTVFLLVVGAFRLINQEIEDAAHVCGRKQEITLLKVTLPVLMPALTVATLYKFAGDLNDMDIPLLLGLQKQIYVLPTLIFFSAFYARRSNGGFATALVLAVYYYRADSLLCLFSLYHQAGRAAEVRYDHRESCPDADHSARQVALSGVWAFLRVFPPQHSAPAAYSSVGFAAARATELPQWRRSAC